MNKEQYFKNLEDIITDPIYVGTSIEELNDEINNNSWRITLEQSLSSEITVNDFVEFFSDVIQNRKHQLSNANETHGMIFYLWFDRMASQIRFNLISDFHDNLPFQCEIDVLESIETIIQDFLEYPFLNGLPIDGNSDESEQKPYKLEVYKTVLSK
jgi:hypothetical protein